MTPSWFHDFPAVASGYHFLDNAATTQKPRAVIDAITAFLERGVTNPGRTSTSVELDLTGEIETLRTRLAHLIGDREKQGQIILTSGATEAANMLAFGLAHTLKEGDRVLISALDHHATFFSWGEVCRQRGATLEVLPLGEEEGLDLEAVERACAGSVKYLVTTHASNVLGTVLPIREMARLVHAAGGLLIVDAAQSVPHGVVSGLRDADAVFFSAHKMYGPSGIGALWMRRPLLAELRPTRWGGGMSEGVDQNGFARLTEPPACFEAGTRALEGIVGWNAALAYLCTIDTAQRRAHEEGLDRLVRERLEDLGAVLLSGGVNRVPATSFTFPGIHPHDLATVLSTHRVLVRAGQHCASQTYRALGVSAAVRVSLGLTTSEADIDALCAGIIEARRILL